MMYEATVFLFYLQHILVKICISVKTCGKLLQSPIPSDIPTFF